MCSEIATKPGLDRSESTENRANSDSTDYCERRRATHPTTAETVAALGFSLLFILL